jgi:hypothetical protein
MKMYLQCACLFLWILNAFSYSYRVIKTPIFHFSPAIKQHHVVIIKTANRNRIYAVDYTPVKQNWKTMIRLFLGMSVPAKIRVIFLENDCLHCGTDEEMEEKWKKAKLQVNTLMFPPILKLKEQSKWKDPQKMNLYVHNCQHFSHDLIAIL